MASALIWFSWCIFVGLVACLGCLFEHRFHWLLYVGLLIFSCFCAPLSQLIDSLVILKNSG